ncbi:MAG: hypothetical protein A3H98_11905 [Bacteroidetes bacterium RIFCSPLOWO2_02_FULL_36_8]|nr:MAG: hypothetical protein A3H98_11905 [Bacteroidetes bacterium RIFCSPLOWO2_02_FULL_36_8]OFY69581.1 MAG: hypothetical protein A3G23_11125 [Bacteroidetes bacterium RIFCSPLOWO2_12_FULL_37_12]
MNIKNKKLLYYLIPLSVLIWGMIFYKIFSYVNPEKSTSAKNTPASISFLKQTDNILSDYQLIGVARDPFLDKATEKLSNNEPIMLPVVKNNPIPKVKVQTKKKPEIIDFDLSFVSYNGNILNKRTHKKVAILNIYNKGYILSPGESQEPLQLISIYNDSVLIKYKDQNFIINRNGAKKSNSLVISNTDFK